MKIKDRIKRSIPNRKSEIILRKDFQKMGSQSQISRALTSLQKEGFLVRLGYGVYAKAKRSSITEKSIPRISFEELMIEAMRRLDIDVQLGKSLQEYQRGETTQMPMRFILDSKDRIITRKLSIGKKALWYENDYS